MNKPVFTIDQQKAIDLRNSDILVSAAAGSGKTAVLVERIIQIITNDEKPIDIDRLLVVTFTEAAASEMKARILAAINKKLEENPENEHLSKQVMLIHKANITTIHSFCLGVVRKYFYLIDVDPSFSIVDSTEAELLKIQLMRELFEELYITDNKELFNEVFQYDNNESFLELVECFGDKVKDDSLQNFCINVYNFIQSSPMPEKWLDENCEKLNISTLEELEKAEWYPTFLYHIEETINSALIANDLIYDLCHSEMVDEKSFATVESDRAKLMNVLDNMEKGFVELYNSLRFSFDRITLKLRGKDNKSEEATAYCDNISDIRNKYVKLPIAELNKKVFFVSPKNILKNVGDSYYNIKTITQIVKAFSNRFYELKRNRNIADFSDFEHLCIKALIDKNSTIDNIILTPASLELREYFHEILTDEYQDSNLVQEMILSSISKKTFNQKNRFMVGDIKQSIYKFRMANPEIFIGKYNKFSDEGDEKRINLSLNFRSRENILNCINYIFKQIMSLAREVEYDKYASLYYGANYPISDSNLDTEVVIIDCDDEINEKDEAENNADDNSENNNEEDDILDLSNAELEAKVVCDKILSLFGKNEKNEIFQVYDKSGSYRNVEYSDILILLRSPKSVSETFLREFAKMEIACFFRNIRQLF